MDKDVKLVQDIRVSQVFLKKLLSSNDVNTLNVVSLQVHEMKVGEIKLGKAEPSPNLPLNSSEEMIMQILESLPDPKYEALEALATRALLKRFTYREAAEFLRITQRGMSYRARRAGIRKKDLARIDHVEEENGVFQLTKSQ